MKHASFPVARLRRLRRTATLRELTRETRLEVSDLVYPMFVDDCETLRTPIDSMPGIDVRMLKPEELLAVRGW